LQRKITIKVGNNEFPYNFIKSIGHIVILDRLSLEVKFYQSKGYSVRKEDLKNILNGKRYLKKITNALMEVDVVNKDITEVLGSSKSIEMLLKSSVYSTKSHTNIYDEINGRPVRCSIFPIKISDKNEGAVLKVEDLSEVKKIIDEKDEILRKLLEIEDMVYDPFTMINGESSGMKEILSYAKKAALSSLTILVMGESGTGKSLIAKAIHEYSKRREKRFVEINCGALSENLLESELFGYVPGAFTGANREGKKGLIEFADGGTVFLDEISEMPVNLQVKLLHVIQDKKVIPVGGTTPIYVDVRFICATNKNLIEMVSTGRFREDLYYRINVMPLKMPALRDRKEDMHSICQSIISKICRREGLQYKILSNEAFKTLYEYDFPGNIRELENTLERALSMSEGQYIIEEDILLPHSSNESKKNLAEILTTTEKNTIINCLKQYNGDKQKVMEVLDIKKTAFYEKVKKYNIDIK
jgi:transcriptional regulator with PAS, ATPase and Fis domain